MKRILLILSICVTAVCCSRPKAAISIYPKSLSFSFDGGQDTIHITSNYNWVANTTSESITISPPTGSTDIPAIIHVAPNTEEIIQEMTVTFSTYNVDDIAQEDLYIIQTFRSASIAVEPVISYAPHTSDTVRLSLLSSYIWGSRPDDSFLKVIPNCGLSDNDPQEIAVVMPPNLSEEPQTFTIDFFCSNIEAADTVTITIIQNGEPDPTVSFDIHEVSVPTSGETFSVLISSNFPWNATISDGISDIAPPFGKEGETEMSIIIPENGSGKEIKHIVAVQASSSSKMASDTLTIIQNK